MRTVIILAMALTLVVQAQTLKTLGSVSDDMGDTLTLDNMVGGSTYGLHDSDGATYAMVGTRRVKQVIRLIKSCWEKRGDVGPKDFAVLGTVNAADMCTLEISALEGDVYLVIKQGGKKSLFRLRPASEAKLVNLLADAIGEPGEKVPVPAPPPKPKPTPTPKPVKMPAQPR